MELPDRPTKGEALRPIAHVERKGFVTMKGSLPSVRTGVLTPSVIYAWRARATRLRTRVTP